MAAVVLPDKDPAAPSTIVDKETPEPQPEKPRSRARRKRKQPAPWKPLECVVFKPVIFGKNRQYNAGELLVVSSERQYNDLKRRGVVG